MSLKKKRFLTGFLIGGIAAVLLFRYVGRPSSAEVANTTPEAVRIEPIEQGSDQPSMADVLELAESALDHMSKNLRDYTARFVKQETDLKGNLMEESEMLVKVQTRFQSEQGKTAKRVYMKFQAPESTKGREVIWGEDLYDRQMAVHEVGLLVGLKTIWLDPNGMIAMSGQRYPISELGLVRLVEKLIERGEKDRDNPDIHVTLSPDDTFPGVTTELIQVHRKKPSGEEDDFSLAEIVIDRERMVILRYRSFGWPEGANGTAPLLESYTYHDLKMNVGLEDSDFDYKNPEYDFPAF